jgi:hypothetical protein
VEITIGGTPRDLGEVARYADAGVGRVIARPWQRSRDAVEGLRRYADEVVHPSDQELARSVQGSGRGGDQSGQENDY